MARYNVQAEIRSLLYAAWEPCVFGQGGIDRQGGRSKNFYEMLLLKNNCTSPKTFFSI
jgi:hypothetical protein